MGLLCGDDKYMTTETLVQIALKNYPKAKPIAVENFCFSAPTDKIANEMNLNEDARMYGWNSDTLNAIRSVLRAENKLS